MDVEKALLDNNLILGEIKSKVESMVTLQTLANGRTGKLEAKVEMLENAKNKTEGQIASPMCPSCERTHTQRRAVLRAIHRV